MSTDWIEKELSHIWEQDFKKESTKVEVFKSNLKLLNYLCVIQKKKLNDLLNEMIKEYAKNNGKDDDGHAFANYYELILVQKDADIRHGHGEQW